MAKRRRMKTRTVYKKAKRYAKRSVKGSTLIQPDSMLYGAGRRYLSQLISPITSGVGILGNLADNAILGTGLYLLSKRSKGMVRNIAIKGLVAENVLAGDDIGNMIMGKMNGGNAGSDFAYG